MTTSLLSSPAHSSPLREASHRLSMPNTPAPSKRRRLNFVPVLQPTQRQEQALVETSITQKLITITKIFEQCHLGKITPTKLKIGKREITVTEAKPVNLQWKEDVRTEEKIYRLYLVTIEGFQDAGIERFKDVTHCMIKFLNINNSINMGQSYLEVLEQEIEDYSKPSLGDNRASCLDFEILKNDGQLIPDRATHGFHLQEYISDPNLEQIAICCGSAYRNVFVPFKTKIGSKTVTITAMIKPLGSGNYNDVYRVNLEGFEDMTECVIKFANEDMRSKSPQYRQQLLKTEMKQYEILRKHFPDNLALWEDFEILIKEGKFRLENITYGFRIQKFFADYPIPKEQGNLDPEGSERFQADAQLKSIIQTMYDNELSCDLEWSNLGIDENKKIILRDIIHPDEEVHSESSQLTEFKVNRSEMASDLINKGLKTLAPEGSQRYQYLAPITLKREEL